MSDTELAWAAGLVDGEGCFHAKKRNGVPRLPMFAISQVDKEPLDRFVAAVGMGKVAGPYKPSSKLSKKLQYKVTIYGKDWWKLIELLWPYLCIPKKNQIKKVAQAVDTEQNLG